MRHGPAPRNGVREDTLCNRDHYMCLDDCHEPGPFVYCRVCGIEIDVRTLARLKQYIPEPKS